MNHPKDHSLFGLGLPGYIYTSPMDAKRVMSHAVSRRLRRRTCRSQGPHGPMASRLRRRNEKMKIDEVH